LGKRVVVIGLDGATLDIMRPMMYDQGRLKNFKKLAENGTCGTLTSTILPLSAAAWSSFVTGKNPAKHGVYDFAKRLENSYQHVPITSLDRRSKTIWDYASEQGKRCCIVNIPITYPPNVIKNGLMISGFPYPEGKADFAEPKEIISEIREKLGITRLHKPSPHFLQPGDEKKLVKDLIQISKNQTEVIKYLLQKQTWDLFVTVFDATDVISHFFWQYIDPKNPRYDERKAAEFGPLFYDIYDYLDSAFGEIKAKLSEDDNIFVISDHGFGPVYYAVYMNNWLMKNNYLRLKTTPGTRARKILFNLGVTTDFLFRTAKKLRLVGTSTYAYSKKSRSLELSRKFSLSLDDIDWSKTSVYSYGNYGQFFVNLKGREPMGNVERGEEYDKIVDDIISKVKELKDPKTGRTLFDIVYRKDEIYSGPFFDSAADIVFFDSTMTYRAHRLFEFGSRSMIAPDPIYSGSHRMEGMLIAGGPDIGRHESVSASLIDLAPTIMHIMGLEIPPDMDGRVLIDLFSENSESKQRPIQKYMPNLEIKEIQTIAQKVARSLSF
jgi:predicted AlkP superfamily phosphohydrolase/phosphomutase